MKLTVVIPVFRTEATLDRCVQSVVGQTYDDMEIILVDDGSPDQCPLLCDHWAQRDRRIRVIHQPNGGLSVARNAGIEAAQGDYITFVDSDDFLDTDTYRQVIPFMADADIVEFPIFWRYYSSEQERRSFGCRTYDDMGSYWLHAKAYAHTYAWNKVYRRSLFDEVRFPAGRVFEDVATLPRLLLQSKRVITTDSGCYYYCYNSDGITSTASGVQLRMLLESHLYAMTLWQDDAYYMHVLNTQMDVCRLTGDQPVLPSRRVSPLASDLDTKVRLKAVLLGLIGVKGLCKLNKMTHKAGGGMHSVDKPENVLQRNAEPLISFIVPVYNIPADMLRACIESILELPLPSSEREIIIVDDGSDVPAADILADFTSSIVLHRIENSGVSVARNQGLDMAKGEFVQFVDGDDQLLRTPYMNIIETVRHTNADMVMFDFADRPADGDKRQRQAVMDPMSGVDVLGSRNIHGSAWGYLFRHDLSAHIRFTPHVAYGEDEEFTARLLLCAKAVCVTSLRAYFYREREKSAIHSVGNQDMHRRLDDNRGVLFRLDKLRNGLPSKENGALGRRIAQLTMDYVYNTIMLTRNEDELCQRVNELKDRGLFPLPNRHYTMKYSLFRMISNTAAGRSLMLRLLPQTKKER